jgi:uroporphyrinogen-III synthase
MAESAALARELGLKPLCATVVDLRVLHNRATLEGLEELRSGRADIVVFASSTAVKALSELAGEEDWRGWLKGIRVVAIGPVTAEVARRLGTHVDAVPPEYTSVSVSTLLAPQVRGKRVVLLRSDHGSEELDGPLRGAGAEVVDAPLYSIAAGGGEGLEELIAAMVQSQIDLFAFTSSMSARSFLDALQERHPGKATELLSKTTVGAIGEPTAQALRARGVRVDVVPAEATFPALLRALADSA